MFNIHNEVRQRIHTSTNTNNCVIGVEKYINSQRLKSAKKLVFDQFFPQYGRILVGMGDFSEEGGGREEISKHYSLWILQRPRHTQLIRRLEIDPRKTNQ